MAGMSGAGALPASSPRHRLAGIALMIGAVACFSCLDSTAKALTRTIDPLQIAAVRYIGSFLFVGAFFNPWSRAGILRTHRLGLQCGRALCLALATICAFSALGSMRLTQVTSITFTTPLIVTLLAGPILGERLGVAPLLAVLAGFAGVLLVTRPTGGDLHAAALLAVAAACLNALYSIATRILAGQDSAETTMFYTGLVGAALFLPVLPFVWINPPTALGWILLPALGAFGALGHWLLILAHRKAPASVIAPFFYTQLIWAGLLGYLVFGDAPDGWTLAGGAIVIASGLFLVARERAGPARPGR